MASYAIAFLLGPCGEQTGIVLACEQNPGKTGMWPVASYAIAFLLGPLRRADRDSARLRAESRADRDVDASGGQIPFLEDKSRPSTTLPTGCPVKKAQKRQTPQLFSRGVRQKSSKTSGQPDSNEGAASKSAQNAAPPCFFPGGCRKKARKCFRLLKRKKPRLSSRPFLWAQTDLNRRPPACKAGALNQLSYAPFSGPQR